MEESFLLLCGSPLAAGFYPQVSCILEVVTDTLSVDLSSGHSL